MGHGDFGHAAGLQLQRPPCLGQTAQRDQALRGHAVGLQEGPLELPDGHLQRLAQRVDAQRCGAVVLGPLVDRLQQALAGLQAQRSAAAGLSPAPRQLAPQDVLQLLVRLVHQRCVQVVLAVGAQHARQLHQLLLRLQWQFPGQVQGAHARGHVQTQSLKFVRRHLHAHPLRLRRQADAHVAARRINHQVAVAQRLALHAPHALAVQKDADRHPLGREVSLRQQGQVVLTPIGAALGADAVHDLPAKAALFELHMLQKTLLQSQHQRLRIEGIESGDRGRRSGCGWVHGYECWPEIEPFGVRSVNSQGYP